MRVGSHGMSNFQIVLKKTGWGAYHKFLLTTACMCAISENGALASLSFALPMASCDLLIPETYFRCFYITLLLGMAFGGMGLSILADSLGRKNIVHLSLTLTFVSLLGAAFSNDWMLIVIFLFLLGAGLASNSNIIRVLLSECLTIEQRAKMLIVVDLAGSIGYVTFCVINWWIVPYASDFTRTNFRFCTFRIIFALPALLMAVMACSSALILPSFRFLLLQRQYGAAIKVLQQMYTMNKNRLQEDLGLQVQDVRFFINDYDLDLYPDTRNCLDQILYIVRRHVQSVTIFKERNFLKSLLTFMTLNVMISLGLLLMNIWLARTLSDQDKNCLIKGIEMPYFENYAVNSCKFSNGRSIYHDFFVISVGIALGKVLLLVLVAYFPRRLIIMMLYVFCGAFCCLIIVLKASKVVPYVVAVVILTLYSAIDSILTINIIEAFPTAIRGTAIGYIRSLPYLTRGICVYLLNVSCDLAPIVIGIMMFFGSLFGCFMQERRQLPMVE